MVCVITLLHLLLVLHLFLLLLIFGLAMLKRITLVLFHYVNPDWQLEKRVIGFRLIDESHSGDNIAERVYAVLDEYGLTAKVFSFTLDNASANNKAIETLAPELSSYVGTVDSDFVGTIDSLQPKHSGYVGTLFCIRGVLVT
jgi:hypothetical protein